jgi:transcription antitermination factor NusG
VNVNFNHGRWCAVQVRPRYEMIVSTILRNKGYEQYLPLYRVNRRWSDRHKEFMTPLFSGYVFCRLNSEIRGAIVTTPGVIRIVGTRKEIAMIDDHEIEAIQRIVNSGFRVEPCPYTIGDRVRFTSGPFEGVEGIVTHYKGRRHLVLSVTLIQSSISVEVDSCDFNCLTKAMPPLSEASLLTAAG